MKKYEEAQQKGFFFLRILDGFFYLEIYFKYTGVDLFSSFSLRNSKTSFPSTSTRQWPVAGTGRVKRRFRELGCHQCFPTRLRQDFTGRSFPSNDSLTLFPGLFADLKKSSNPLTA